jgi:CheY-like chemotaxis protein
MGAFAVVRKQVSREALEASIDGLVAFARRPTRRLLAVAPGEGERAALEELLGSDDVAVTAVSRADEALATLRSDWFDCVVSAVALPDASAAQLIARVTSELGGCPPVVIAAGADDPDDEHQELLEAVHGAVARIARSDEQLFGDVMLFLHRAEAALPPDQRAILRRAHATDELLRGRTVLIVDDDVRNIFAVTSVLERHGLRALYAEEGRTAIELLQANAGIEAVLMDIMMPELDGYETMAAIRQIPGKQSLPIIALTAKAMKGDRERCLESGASDYITKPVDTDQLLSLLRVWLNAMPAPSGEARA